MREKNGVPAGSFLGSLSPNEATELDRMGKRRRYQRGSVLCAEGETSRWLLVVISGHVKMTSLLDDGSEVLLDFQGPGALIGELEAIDGKPRLASARALNHVEALVIEYSAFTDFVRAHDRVMALLLETLCERLREAHLKRIEFSTLDATKRVATRLVELANHYGEPAERGISISLAITQDELAAFASVSREAANKALGRLRERGWISTSRRSVTVSDIAALRRLVNHRDRPGRGLVAGPAEQIVGR